MCATLPIVGAPSKTPPRAGSRIPSYVKDSWANLATGVNVRGRDKRLESVYNTHTVDYREALELYRGNWLAARLVDLPVDTAFSECVGLTTTTGERGEVVRKVLELASEEKLKVELAFAQACKWERAYGGSAIVIGAKDGATDWAEPLDMSKIKSVDFLTVLEPQEIAPRYWYNNPLAPKYDEVEIYQINPSSRGTDSRGKVAMASALVHESRLVVFGGVKVSKRQVTGTTPWFGDSVFTRVIGEIRDSGGAYDSVSALLNDFSQAVYGIANLAQVLTEDNGDGFKERMRAMEFARSVLGALVIDKDAETFERKQTPVSGLADLVDRVNIRTSGAFDMPLTVLFGVSPAGLNATGESDIRLFYNKVENWRTKRVLSPLRYVYSALIASCGVDPSSFPWDLSFPPLWKPTRKELAEAYSIVAGADEKYINLDVVSRSEVRNRFKGSEFALTLQVTGDLSPDDLGDHEDPAQDPAEDAGDPAEDPAEDAPGDA